ncbi:MAG: hypothetical protein KGZ68_04460 [Dechloromonas sp.]|nr:hypothetical protein [Dechloromonas sp.]
MSAPLFPVVLAMTIAPAAQIETATPKPALRFETMTACVSFESVLHRYADWALETRGEKMKTRCDRDVDAARWR